MGLIAAQDGRPGEALELCRQALEVSRTLGFQHNVAYGLHVLTVAAAAQGRLERAAWAWGAAAALYTTLGVSMSRAEHDQFDSYVIEAREQLGAEAWQRAFEQGRVMPLEQALAHALGQADAEE